MRKITVVIFAVFFSGSLWAASNGIPTKDIEGAQDHPLLSRYPGSVIMDYRQSEFDQYKGAIGPASGYKKPPPTKAVEGKVTKITYVGPAGRSIFEIYKNYENALRKSGFEILFSGDRETIGNKSNQSFVEPIYGQEAYCLKARESDAKNNPERYLFGQLTRGKANVWVALFVTTSQHKERPACRGPSYIQVDIVEEKQMESDLVSVSAAEIARALDESGHIAIYGIYFDTDSARLKPESASALAEIAKLLRERPRLSLFVVGHTDSVGDISHNLKLSNDRAQEAVRELVRKHRVTANRLSSHGVGPLAPVESNKTESGRAKNRRVELIER